MRVIKINKDLFCITYNLFLLEYLQAEGFDS